MRRTPKRSKGEANPPIGAATGVYGYSPVVVLIFYLAGSNRRKSLVSKDLRRFRRRPRPKLLQLNDLGLF